VYKLYSKVSIGVGVGFFLAGALFVLAHSRIWATYSILLGVYLILNGQSFILGGIGQKVTRRLSFGFLGAALVSFGIGSARFLS
jgi:hypothetical protein